MSMDLSAGDRRLGLLVGQDDDGLPVVAPLQGKCTALVSGDRRIGILAGETDDGVPVVAWSYQKCKDGTSHFEAGKRYLGLLVGETDDGTPVIASWCEDCDAPMCRDICTRHGGANDAPGHVVANDHYSETHAGQSIFGTVRGYTVNLGSINSCLDGPSHNLTYEGTEPVTFDYIFECLGDGTFQFTGLTINPATIVVTHRHLDVAVAESLDPLLVRFTGIYQNTSIPTNGHGYHLGLPGIPYEIIVTE